MNGLGVLMLGFGLGLRHATDVDHVVVVSSLLQREPGTWRAARVAALWGAGHSLSFLGVGLVVVLAGVRVPPRFEVAAELLVAAMLMGFGVLHLASALTGAREDARAASEHAGGGRALLVGVIHGLAGSAGIGLLATTTIRSRAWAVAYLGLFGLGTVAGMMLVTVLLSMPITWTMRRQGVRRGAMTSAALASLSLGVWLMLQAVCGPR